MSTREPVRFQCGFALPLIVRQHKAGKTGPAFSLSQHYLPQLFLLPQRVQGNSPGFSSFASFKASVNRIFICHIFHICPFSTLVLQREIQHFTPSPDLLSKQKGKAADFSRMAPTPHSLHIHRSIPFSIRKGIWRLEIQYTRFGKSKFCFPSHSPGITQGKTSPSESIPGFAQSMLSLLVPCRLQPSWRYSLKLLVLYLNDSQAQCINSMLVVTKKQAWLECQTFLLSLPSQPPHLNPRHECADCACTLSARPRERGVSCHRKIKELKHVPLLHSRYHRALGKEGDRSVLN